MTERVLVHAWGNPEHPFPAISLPCTVQANHNDTQNSTVRQRCSAYQ